MAATEFWLGVTAGLQTGWDRDIPLLRTIPAVVRFVSVEPMLEPIGAKLDGIDWVICVGETLSPAQRAQGNVAKVTDPDWMRGLLHQCHKADVAFFLKQMTERAPIPDDLLVRQFPVPRALIR